MNWDNQNLGESFVTPHVGEVTRVGPREIEQQRVKQEAMEIIKDRTAPLGMRVQREVLAAVQLLLNK